MKILFVQDSLGTGGAERSNAELWYFLREHGIQFKIIALEHRKEGIEKEIIQENFDVYFIKSGNFLFETIQIRRIISNYEPDIIHSVLLRSNLRTRVAQIGMGKIHVESLVNCTYAEIRYSDPKINSSLLKLYEKLDQITGKFGVDKFIPITHAVKNHYVKKLKVNPAKMIVIPRGRKKNDFYLQASKKKGLRPKPITFIHVGRQEFQKGHLVLLEAIKVIDDQLHANDVQFLFCGRKGNASKEIDEFLKKNQLQTEIIFLGHRDDIPQLLAKADVFVFPSLYEGLGGALIEAQAAGLPIICSDIPVFKEVVGEKNSFFFKLNNSRDLSQRILQILNNPEQRLKMGKESLYNFEQKFNLYHINYQLFELYKSLVP